MLDDYIDLANTYLFVEAQIVDDDDTALDGGADVGPVNLWFHYRPACTLTELTLKHYSAMAQLPKNLN
jgi:hypothetical protein